MEEYFNQAILNKAYNDKWILAFPVPGVLRNINDDKIKNVMSDEKLVSSNMFFISIEKTSVPGPSVPSKSVQYAGQNLKISSHARPAYDDLSVSFTIDNRFSNYYFIHKWLNVMNDQEASTYDEDDLSDAYELSDDFGQKILRAMKQYQVDADLIMLDEYNKPVVTFKLLKFFPVSLGSIEVNYQESNKITVDATFSLAQVVLKLPDAVEGIITTNQQVLTSVPAPSLTSAILSTTPLSTTPCVINPFQVLTSY